MSTSFDQSQYRCALLSWRHPCPRQLLPFVFGSRPSLPFSSPFFTFLHSWNSLGHPSLPAMLPCASPLACFFPCAYDSSEWLIQCSTIITSVEWAFAITVHILEPFFCSIVVAFLCATALPRASFSATNHPLLPYSTFLCYIYISHLAFASLILCSRQFRSFASHSAPSMIECTSCSLPSIGLKSIYSFVSTCYFLQRVGLSMLQTIHIAIYFIPGRLCRLTLHHPLPGLV